MEGNWTAFLLNPTNRSTYVKRLRTQVIMSSWSCEILVLQSFYDNLGTQRMRCFENVPGCQKCASNLLDACNFACIEEMQLWMMCFVFPRAKLTKSSKRIPAWDKKVNSELLLVQKQWFDFSSFRQIPAKLCCPTFIIFKVLLSIFSTFDAERERRFRQKEREYQVGLILCSSSHLNALMQCFSSVFCHAPLAWRKHLSRPPHATIKSIICLLKIKKPVPRGQTCPPWRSLAPPPTLFEKHCFTAIYYGVNQSLCVA